MSTTVELNNLVINDVESNEVFDYMYENGFVNPNELYLVHGGSDSSQNENVLPEISASTSGMFLTNNGENASWVSIPTAEGVSF